MKTQHKMLTICLISALGLSISTQAAPLLAQNGLEQSSSTIENVNAWLEIDTQAFEQNIATLETLLDGKSKICAVVKADAYGNGLDLLMPSIIKMDVPCLAITSNEEARIIRAHGYQGQVVRIRTATLGEIQDAMQYDIEEMLGNPGQAQAVNQLAAENGKTLRYHFALNSGGMDRNGLDVNSDEGKQEALDILELPNLEIVGIMTHFPVEEAEDVRKGLAQFNDDSAWLIEAGQLNRDDIILHTANSFTTLEVPEARLDMVRTGGLLYGDTIAEHTEYKPIMKFKSRVGTINHYKAGTSVGYDRTYILDRDSLLANLPVGYSDGYRRVFTNAGHVLINGHRVPVVGKVSMNTTMVDITDFPDISAGDEVILYGADNGVEISRDEVEELNGALLADLYTVWGNSNPKFKKELPDAKNMEKKDSVGKSVPAN